MDIITRIFKIFKRKKETPEEKFARLVNEAAKKGNFYLSGLKIEKIKVGKKTKRGKSE